MDHPTNDELIRQGAALFNHGEYYKCHEVFEEAWMAAEGPQRLFLQGIIQLAVALHHLTNGNATGAKRLLREGSRKLREQADEQEWFVVEPLTSAAEEILRGLESDGAAKLDPPPQIRFKPAAR